MRNRWHSDVKSATSSQSHSAVGTIAKSTVVAMKPIGGKRPVSIHPAVARVLWYPLPSVNGRPDVKLSYSPEAECTGATLTSPRAESDRQID
jgi:hypothetical protein